MVFPLEKILTVSFEGYCGSIGTKQEDYDIKGVHYFLNDSLTERHLGPEEALKRFAGLIPTEAVAVVDFHPSSSSNNFNNNYLLSGTALIPKKEYTSKK